MSIMDGITDYAARLEAFRRSDAERDALVSELITQLEDLKTRYQEKADDYSNEVASRRMWQAKAATSEKELLVQKQAAAGNNFALVLIDGDGALFQDYLYSNGKDGGADAAHQLHTEIKNQLKSTYPDANVSDWTIVVQVVLNIQGLAYQLQARNIIATVGELLNFASAFSSTHPLFSFLDVGGGKERADHKIRETLRLFVPNAHCKHVFFAPCHDNGYLTVLEPYRRDPAIAARMTLIETRPAERGFVELGLPLIKLSKIFRNEDLQPATRSSNGMPLRTISHNVPPPMSVATPKPASPSPSNEGVSLNPSASSWATMGKNSTSKTIDIAPKKSTTAASRPHYIVNVYDERLDVPLPNTDGGAEGRYNKRMESWGNKACNAYHLTGKCPKGEQWCDYHHGERLTPGELLVLKHKARSMSCPQGLYCTNVDCTFGHVCKFGDRCTKPQCFFKDTHGMDMEPAKRIFADGNEEWIAEYLRKYNKN